MLYNDFNGCLGGGAVNGLQDVAFLPCLTTFYTTFLNNCGKDECHGTVTRRTTVVGGKQVQILFLQQSLFASAKFHGDHKTAICVKVNVAIFSIGDVTRYKTAVSICQYGCV